jgi:hypothetical protein
LLRAGGFYVIDDLLPQSNWPDGHAPKVPALVDDIERRDEFSTVQIFLLAMIENKVGPIHRTAIHSAVVAAGFAWDDNARERAAGMVRVLPPDWQKITAATLWPLYRQEVMAAGVKEPAPPPIAPAFCERGDMSIDDALKRP